MNDAGHGLPHERPPGAEERRVTRSAAEENAHRAEEITASKAMMPAFQLTMLSVLGGIFISFAAIVSTSVTAGGGMAPGFARFLGGLVFSFGLIMVVIAGAELFSANALLVVAAASRRITVRRLLRCWAWIFVGNIIGTTTISVLMVISGVYESGDGSLGKRALEIAEFETSLTIPHAFFSGILANTLVCVAVWMTFAATSLADKVLVIIPPVVIFVASGFQHLVAAFYSITSGLLLRAWAPEGFWAEIGEQSSAYPKLTWSRFVVHSMIPVTLGNLVGGGLLVGAMYWFTFLRDHGRTHSHD